MCVHIRTDDDSLTNRVDGRNQKFIKEAMDNRKRLPVPLVRESAVTASKSPAPSVPIAPYRVPVTGVPTDSSVGNYILFFSYAQTDSAVETVLFYSQAAQRYPPARIFHDSNNRFKLDDLVLHVQRARNVVVFLSSNYCRRPYTLVELHFALLAGANICPVIVEKPGSASFDFGAVAADIKNKKIVEYLDSAGWDLLREHGITVDDVSVDLKKVTNVIAHRFPINQPIKVQNAMFEVIFDSLID